MVFVIILFNTLISSGSNSCGFSNIYITLSYSTLPILYLSSSLCYIYSFSDLSLILLIYICISCIYIGLYSIFLYILGIHTYSYRVSYSGI